LSSFCIFRKPFSTLFFFLYIFFSLRIFPTYSVQSCRFDMSTVGKPAPHLVFRIL
jgi:hypothetical protein